MKQIHPVPEENSVFHEWRVADRDAHAQERIMARASLKALNGEGDAPSEIEREKARTLRQTADGLFKGAMHEFRKRIARIRGSSEFPD
ncbi:MAG: hypothetical protein ABI409_08875 [Ramlibacter sp.]